MLSKHRLLLVNAILALTLLGGYMGRRLEAARFDPKFLERLALPFRGWDTLPMVLTPAEIELLEPDAVLARQYLAPGRTEIRAAGGHCGASQEIHPHSGLLHGRQRLGDGFEEQHEDSHA